MKGDCDDCRFKPECSGEFKKLVANSCFSCDEKEVGEIG